MRKLTGFWNIFVKVLSVALILFQLYTTGVRVFSDIIQRSVHLAFVLTLVFMEITRTEESEDHNASAIFYTQIGKHRKLINIESLLNSIHGLHLVEEL